MGQRTNFYGNRDTTENKSVKYLVYVDILGFEKLAEEIGKKENLSPRIVRSEILIKPTQEEIENLKKMGKYLAYLKVGMIGF